MASKLGPDPIGREISGTAAQRGARVGAPSQMHGALHKLAFVGASRAVHVLGCVVRRT